jgi:flagella basal body P-ring formation protein FlgA
MNFKTTFFRLYRLPSAARRSCVQYLPLLLALEAGGSIALAATLPAELIGATEGFLEQSVTDYLQRSEIQARHEILVHSLDPRLRLNACDQPLEVTLESPSQPLGRVTCRVRCAGSTPWTVFVPAQVRIYREVVVSARPLARNTQLQADDLLLAEMDIGQLKQGYLADAAQAVGKKLTRTLQANQVIPASLLVTAAVVRRGDHVVISARGTGISVRMPGEALSDGGPGDQIRVRNLRSERIIRARVTGPGAVEVQM